MERTITLSSLRAAVEDAYEKFRSMDVADKAAPDPRVASPANPDAFGIAVTLTDGTVIKVGDTATPAAMGSISKAPIHLALLAQYSPQEIAQRSGLCRCCCQGKKEGDATAASTSCAKPKKPHTPVSAKGIRAMSLLQPIGDPDGKWDIYSSLLIGLTGSEPVLSDGLYEKLMGENKSSNTENMLSDADFYLYDDAPTAIELYTKAMSMTESAEQLSALAATIAADGYNPLTKANVFDGALAANVVGLMAAKGPHKMAKPWMFTTGLPALSSFGGTMMGVVPGVMGIAAYSPLVNGTGVSVKAAHALGYIMNTLGLSALGSARVKIDTGA